MRIFDKAQWHIDAGEPATEVLGRIKAVFQYLSEQGLLTPEGEEIMQLGVDSSVSLHERLVNAKGAKFLEAHYDELFKLPVSSIPAKLSELTECEMEG
ncbi:MAG: hypothetical protein LBT23_04960 [Synergistaceae bacterium]|jgi:hypothetical protein|nr:hypothetical protein [Synergistaceae bacterium]